ncbi:MAG: DUF2974 domain-containing protein [Atopobiaceae bacterium]|nr:DUF2974 domain-containing protein [Atopobiaceae bacterium]
MANIIDYARTATDSFAERPLCRVDALCFAWLAYLRLPTEMGVTNRAGVRICDLNDSRLLPAMLTGLHDIENSRALFVAMATSPRFANVRACLYVTESSEPAGMQFSATTFVLPEGAGSCVCFRGTDDTLLGWKEDFLLIGSEAIPAQRRAASYLDEVVDELGGRFCVAGHSKGGALAAYAVRAASEDTCGQLEQCYTLDGPGLSPEVRDGTPYSVEVPLEKVVPHASLVGMLFERSQEELVVVRSSEQGVMQHAPFSWEVNGNDFVRAWGLEYDAWRLMQRLNDCLESMGLADRTAFARLLGWLVDATAETSFSGLLSRWSSNRQAMQAALSAAPQHDRDLFERTMDNLVATVLLGSRQEYGLDRDGTPQSHATYAARRVEDLSAKTNDRLSRIDRYTGR